MDPTDHEITLANLVTELENLYEDLKRADETTIARFKAMGKHTWGIDGHILIRLSACVLVAKDAAGIEHRYTEAEPFHVKSNRHLRDENRELRQQVEALRTTARTLCGLAGLAEPTLGSDANPLPVKKEYERQEAAQ